MNNKNRGILYGFCLGDGCVTKQPTNKNYGLLIGHSPTQRDYIEHKAIKLTEILGGKKINVNSYTVFNKIVGKSYENLQFKKTHPYLNQIHRSLYKTGVKKITREVLDFVSDEGLAYWIMDDGSGAVLKNTRGQFCGCNIRLSTYCLREEAEEIAKWFEDRYNLTCSFDVDKRNNLVSLRFTTLASKKLAEIIRPYIIPSMFYKIEKVLNYSPRVLDPTIVVGEDIV